MEYLGNIHDDNFAIIYLKNKYPDTIMSLDLKPLTFKNYPSAVGFFVLASHYNVFNKLDKWNTASFKNHPQSGLISILHCYASKQCDFALENNFHYLV